MTKKQRQRLEKLWEDNKFSKTPFCSDINLHVIATGGNGKQVTFDIKNARSMGISLLIREDRHR